MMLNKKISALTSAALFTTVAAFAQGESVEQQQTSLLQKLDSLNASVLGLKLNGTAKAGGLASFATSDQFRDDSPTQENQAFTDVNLLLTARPSSETQVHLELRLHKDWQSAFDENNNPVIGHWFSYDGSILNNHVDFNLGYMKVAYTPYTLYTPQQQLLQEPEIFAQKRVEALAQRNLDTTNARLMQGLNAAFHSGQVGPVSDIYAQATGARMRNIAKKMDQVFFDFDWSDRYFYGLRLGTDVFGAHLGVNYTDVFDRELSTRSHMVEKNAVYYEDNSILSAEFGFNSKEIMGKGPVTFGLDGEFAMSNWKLVYDSVYTVDKVDYNVGKYYTENFKQDDVTRVDNRDSLGGYVTKKVTTVKDIRSTEIANDDAKAFYLTGYVNAEVSAFKADLKGTYIQNDSNFWSEMASSPVYRGGSIILNSNAVYSDNAIYGEMIKQYGMSSLENMYFAVYNSNPLNATNLLSSKTNENALVSQKEDGTYLYGRLYNNYKNAHFYRNGYDANVLKRTEMAQAMLDMDPSGSLELPFGFATPDRKGFIVDLDLSFADAIELNAAVSMLTQTLDPITMGENKFTHYAAGLGVDVGRLAPFINRKFKIQGSYDHSEEDAYLKRKSDRIMAGTNVDVIGPLSLLAGYQMNTREFGVPLDVSGVGALAINKVEESLLLVGPRVKLAPNSYLSVQYGLLTDKISFNSIDAVAGVKADELSIDKNVIVADVTVNF